jgi:hypothetical protein
MSTLVELKTEEEWTKHAAEVPATTLQIIYFKAEWAAPVSILMPLPPLTGCFILPHEICKRQC